MNKSELREMIRELVQEALAQEDATKLQEQYDEPGYVIKAWDSPEAKTSGLPSFDSSKDGTKYPSFDEVISMLQSEQLSDLGAYEITWIKSGTESK
jgi:hypothetical protein